MKALIDRDNIRGLVKVYLYEETPSGRAWLWPVEYEEFGWSWYRHVEDNMALSMGAEVRPALEMNLAMWAAFTEAMLNTGDVRVDALGIIAETLKLEQGRVDKLLGALVERPMLYTAGEVRKA